MDGRRWNAQHAVKARPNRRSLVPGTVIVVDGYQSKDRSNRANGRDVTFEDGSKIFMAHPVLVRQEMEEIPPRGRFNSE